jgi:SAM-dependent methyltransferase
MSRAVNRHHEANRQHWDDTLAKVFQDQDDEGGVWRRCVEEQDVAFDCPILPLIDELSGSLDGKRVCVIASGDSHSCFAFAGMGAEVTSVDQSIEQLKTAEKRAEILGVSIRFVLSDVADMNKVDDESFDLVCSTNGFFVWVSDLGGVFSEVSRILRPGGHYIFHDIHPFQRPWGKDMTKLEVERPYGHGEPLHVDGKPAYSFHWTMSDLLNGLIDSGLTPRRIEERSPKDASYWEHGKWYLPPEQPDLADWKRNPWAALPTWLQVASRKV